MECRFPHRYQPLIFVRLLLQVHLLGAGAVRAAADSRADSGGVSRGPCAGETRRMEAATAGRPARAGGVHDVWGPASHRARDLSYLTHLTRDILSLCGVGETCSRPHVRQRRAIKGEDIARSL